MKTGLTHTTIKDVEQVRQKVRSLVEKKFPYGEINKRRIRTAMERAIHSAHSSGMNGSTSKATETCADFMVEADVFDGEVKIYRRLA